MKSDLLRDFKFSDILELNHGKNIAINFQITSYQFNPIIIDSSLVISSKETTLLNANDSKTFGFSLKQIINNHPKIDFVFRSHSSATPIPQCIKGKEIKKTDRKPSDYVNDFIGFAKVTNAKFAVPFASSHVYLHPLTTKFNKFYSNPAFVKKIFDSKIQSKQECVIMPSNSSWSTQDGFCIQMHDYSKIDNDIKKLKKIKKTKLLDQNKKDKIQNLNIKPFQKYYKIFFEALSFPIKLLNFRFAFLINEKKTNINFLCIIDGSELKTSNKNRF